MAIPKQTSTWDERRNTSRVFPAPVGAHKDALKAVAAWKRSDPAHYAWVAEGAPNLTEAEHLERFGVPYSGHRSRRAAT